MLDSTKYFGNFGASFYIISLRSETLHKRQIFEKANLSMEKKFRSIFSRTIELEKFHETTYKRPQGVLTTFVQVIRSFL